MRVQNILSLLGAAGLALAQRPSSTPICDYYTTALLKNNTAANQYTLLTLLVNTAVIGNYTQPNVGVKVPGILTPGTYNGTAVNLLPYFDGMLASSNGNGTSGVAVNFLDDGGATPLMMNKPSNGTSSLQYNLLTHLYQYFGALLGCSQYGQGAFPAYQGRASMYQVHKFMDLDVYEVSYFVQQVGLAAASFGVAQSDVQIVGDALMNLFGYKCAAPATVIPSQGLQLESICIADNCPVAPNATCSLYQSNITMPAVVSGNSSTAASGSNATVSKTGASAAATQTTNGGAQVVGQVALAAVGVAGAFFL